MANVARLPETNYSASLTAKEREYNSLINQAFIENIINGQKPSVKEARLYKNAADVCREIVNISGKNMATAKKWAEIGAEAMEKYDEVVRKLKAMEGIPDEPPRSKSAQTSSGKTGDPAAASAKPSGREIKTKSDFVTRNACIDVPADTIATWYKDRPSHDFSDVVGLEDLKSDLMSKIEKHLWKRTNAATGEKALTCVLLYGPPGTGKTFFIESYIAELMKKGFTYIQLHGADIHAPRVGVAEKTIQIACREAIDHAPSVIFIDEFDDVSVDRGDPKAESHEKRLTTALIEEYNTLLDADKPIFFIGTTNHPEKIDSAWISRFKDMRKIHPLPCEAQRELYFAKKLENIRLTEGLTIDFLVDKTDSFSYRDLDALVSEIFARKVEEAKQIYSVMNEDGSINIEESDKAVSEAILANKMSLTAEQFKDILHAKPPAPKEDIIDTLRAYEERAQSILSEGD